MKNLFYILLLSVFFTSCNSTKSAIITSKKEAIKKNVYDGKLNIRTVKIDKKTQEVKRPIATKTETPKKQENVILNHNNDEDIIITSDNSSYLIEQIINSATDNIGSPYHSGGTSKSGFDCSGLLYATFKNFDITLPRTSSEMSRIGKIISEKNAKKGDLIFFTTNGRSSINHVGIVTEVTDDEIKFVHSSTSRGVMISSTKEAYYSKAFAQLNRVIE